MKRLFHYVALLSLMILALSCSDDPPSKPEDKPEDIIISSLSSTKILPAQEIIIKGSGFGAEQGDSYVEFSGLRAEAYITWSATELKVKVPKITGDGKVVVTKGGRSSAGFDYKLNRDPYIESAGPGAAFPGEVANIYGRNFGAQKGTVTFNGTAASEISKWSDSTIALKVPEGSSTGPVLVITSANDTSNAFQFTVSVYTDPAISSIEPKNEEIKVGTLVTIKGQYFGASQAANYAEFNGVKATDYASWTDTEIKCKVPVGASSGNVTVAVGNQKSKGYYLEIKSAPNPPQITSLDKTEIIINDDLVINGNYFGDNYDDKKCFVYFGTVKAELFSSWTNNKITVVVPKNITDGQLYVEADGKQSNKVSYTIYVPNEFKLNSVLPSSASVGDKVTLSGKGFGAARGSSVVLFTGAEATQYSSWSDKSIEVIVPQNASDGEITVKVGSKVTNGVNFTVQHGVVLLDMALIPAGEFTMGNPNGNPNGFEGDAPTNKIKITKPFYMSKTEITQGEFKKTMDQSNPSDFKSGDKYPVESLTWERAIEFCNKLSERESYTPCYTKKQVSGKMIWVCDFDASGYRLPTEAEWEYAARAGTTGAQYGALNDIAWYGGTTGSNKKPQEVRLKQPNAFGLYDMLGNVAEWVNDWFLLSYYSSMPTTDPKGPDYDGAYPEKGYRGGYFSSSAEEMGVFKRTGYAPESSQNFIGFRVVRKK